MMEKMLRYPGSRPFTIEYKNLFYGRDKDINDLCRFIQTEKITVLYGKSGLGKSSLLNVGIIPCLETELELFHIPIRFGNFTEYKNEEPIKLFTNKIKAIQCIPTFLNKIEDTEPSLWLYFKKLQLNLPDKKGFLITFDQLEELFTYPTGVEEFVSQLAELLNNRMPKNFRKSVQRKLKENPDLLTDKELDLLEQNLNFKVVISIRSDKLSLLNLLSESLPNILRNCYELKPLSQEQAIDAIIQPTTIQDQIFSSPPFQYTETAISYIIRYLTKEGKQSIETFQLQMICQHCESLIIKHPHLNNEISQESLGNIETLFNNYYEDAIEKLKDENDKTAARVFIEEVLIVDDRRISLDKILCLKSINELILQSLTDSRLLRAEPNTTGGINYELCHDTLIPSILRSKVKRVEKEERKKEELQRIEEERRLTKIIEKERIERNIERKRQGKIISIITFFTVISVCVGIYAFYLQNKAESAMKAAIQNEILAKQSLSKYKEEIIKHQSFEIDKLFEKADINMNRGDYETALIYLKKVDSIYHCHPEELERFKSQIKTRTELCIKKNRH